MAAVQFVADRAAFWAELGAVSAPVLLGRLARHLEEVAAGDPEADAALRFAAAHVRSRCLVWPAGPAGSGEEERAGAGESAPSGRRARGAEFGEDRGGEVHRTLRAGGRRARPVGVPQRSGPLLRALPGEGDDASEESGDSSNDDAFEDNPAARPPLVAIGARGGGPWRAGAGTQPDESDSVSDSIPPDGPRAFLLLLPQCCLWPARLLPAVGSLAAHVLWVIALSVAVPVICVHSWQRNNPLSAEGLSRKVGPMIDLTLALKFLVTIPLIITTRRVVVDSTFDAALRADLNSPNGAATQRFFRKGIGAVISVLVVMGSVEFSDGPGRDWYSKFVFMRNVVSVTYLSVFLALYKLSVNRVERMRALIIEPEMSACFWSYAAREYLATTRIIDMLWRVSGFSTTLTVFLASNLVFAAIFSAIGFADLSFNSSIAEWRPWCWALKLGAVAVVMLYMISNINSRCSSNRNAVGSVLYLARHHIGRSKPWCLMEHIAFIQCVEGVPCGVEIAILPVLTASFFAPVIRVSLFVAPIVAGLAYSVAQARA